MRRYLILFVVAMFFLLTAMECYEYRPIVINIVNRSGEKIHTTGWLFYDETILTPKDVVGKFYFWAIDNDSTAVAVAWEDGDIEKVKSFQILLYKQSTLDKYTDKEIKEKSLCDKYYYLTKEQLDSCKYVLTYTGE